MADAVAVDLRHVKADYERLVSAGFGQIPLKTQRVMMGIYFARNREYLAGNIF